MNDRQYTMPHGRLAGRVFEQFMMFIKLIKLGETPIIFAPDYVVMSQETYQDILKNQLTEVTPLLEKSNDQQ